MLRDETSLEEMDRPDCDPGLLRRTYAQFPLVNAAVSGWGRLYREVIRPALPRDRPSTLLDIGCGGGDISVALARQARRDGFDLHVTGIDPDERAHRYATEARAQGRDTAVVFRRATSGDLVAAGERFDVVVSNHVLHHLTAGELAALLSDTEALTGRVAIHSDIVRSRAALLLFGAATLPLARGSFIRRDGLTSIRRSYLPGELRGLVPPQWQVLRRRPYRNLVVFRPGALP
ncbi:class I SAM-dependent methyltransferase [Arthrobacter sp. JSM 101049]|uniref:class I SAM-dependent methyltransferase n=1 Tax=Arthrobacter sp. JSM 101049 TaxID=929097 RepID=UPI00356ACEF3